MEFSTLIIILLVAVIAGFYGVLVGGTSLLTIPTLIFLGLPPQIALATNRFGNLGMPIAGVYKFGKKKLINYKVGLTIAIPALIGAIIGANIMLQISEIVLKKVVAVVTLAALLFVMVKKDVGLEEKKIKPTGIIWILTIFSSFLLGIYGGFYGAAFSTLIMYLLIIVFGQTFLKSAATTKIVTLAMAIAATSIFLIKKKVEFGTGLVLFAGLFIGSYLGAKYSTKLGNVWIKRLFFVVVLVMGVKLLF